ncbi:MAG: type IV pilus modification protein PilV [Gammaproteobacteria bacterium]|nr:type IV pilus modification protein PilV [Gammaproteobacteria bacterium]MYF30389.1 type IV pilus modification protein PilV [Gammaproteobacteria bacterium]MYK46765.1 type IV pilus modification protein PilV [Gammaproteobacteria bacterium]
MGLVTAMRGYSLMEVLVAIVVIGVGALGAAGLQLASSKNTRTALQGTTAVILAQDMAERLRANPQGAYVGVSDGSAPPGFVDCLAARCSAAQLASFDVTLWKCSLGRWRDDAACREARETGVLPPAQRRPGLPMGDGAIAWDGEGKFTVIVTWSGTGPHRVAVSGRR